MTSQTYLKILFILLGVILASAIGYAYYFSKNYPLPVTNRISFDAKIKFIRENIDVDSVDTIIVGSSIGLNNVQGGYLDKASKKANSVLNLSVYESTAPQVEQLLQLSDAFPNLKRMIYSVQYSDFGHKHTFTEYDPDFLIRYMRDELNPIEEWLVLFRGCNNLYFCFNRQREWKEKHTMNNKFTYLGFDSTGSVPLHIYGKDIIGHRWRNPHPGIMNPKSFEAVDRMAARAKAKGIHFYFVQQAYRPPLAKREKIKNALDYFAKTIQNIIGKHDGKFLSLHESLQLSDKYFSDRSHLNDQGSILAAEEIGRFIDETEK